MKPSIRVSQKGKDVFLHWTHKFLGRKATLVVKLDDGMAMDISADLARAALHAYSHKTTANKITKVKNAST